MKNTIHISFLLFGILAIGALASSCKAKDAGDGAGASVSPVPNAKEETVFAINTMTVGKGQIKDYLRVNADVRNSSSVDVVPDTAGKIVKLNVVAGSYVQTGDVIAEIDPSRPGMEYVSSPVKAPISGTITVVPVAIGMTVAPSVPIAKISRGGEMRLVSSLAERYVADIRIGLPAAVSFEAFPGRVFQANITETAPVLDPVSRTLEVKLQLRNPDPRIKVGMFAQVKLITTVHENVIKIPLDAVVARFGTQYVFVVKGDRVEQRKVFTGVDVDGKLEVSDGLNVGDIIVVRGQTLLENNSKVRVINKVPPLPALDNVE